MPHTGTAIERRDGTAAVVLAAERALDEALADSFPASDPPSWNPGMIRPHPADGFATEAMVGAPLESYNGDLVKPQPRRSADPASTDLHLAELLDFRVKRQGFLTPFRH